MRKIKRSLAVLLAALMLATFLLLVASAAISLARTNIEIVPPSVSPTVISYGQTLADVTLSGGECWYVDPDTGAKTKVEGEFKPSSTATKPAVNDAYSISLRFYPTDTATYGTSSGILRSTSTTVTSGTWPTIKVDGLDASLVTAPTAAAIYKGDRISTATLSGGKVNDSQGVEITDGSWTYVDTSIYPEVSGNYNVQWKKTGYDTIKTTVYITVYTDFAETEITESPAVDGTIKAGTAWSEVKLTGGKAVAAGTETAVPGTFSITTRGSATGKTTSVAIQFTPNDPSAYRASTGTMAVTVEKIPYKFVDENGKEIIPEYTIPWGSKTSNYSNPIVNALKKYINAGADNVFLSIGNYDYYRQYLPAGTHYLKIMAYTQGTVGTNNYVQTELEYKLIVEPSVIDMVLSSPVIDGDTATYSFRKVEYSASTPVGTFDVYINGELAFEDVPADGTFSFTPEKSGTFEIKTVYNPGENDNCTVEEMTATYSANLERKFTVVNGTVSYTMNGSTLRCGDTVSISTSNEDFAKWEFTGADGNEVQIEGADPTNYMTSFIMPDYDVTATAYTNAQLSGVDGDDSLLSWIQRFINWLIELYRTIVDNLIPTMESL